MKVLVVKTSSLGDVVHTLPALTDAMQALPGIEFDWLVEEAFAEIPAWHPAVRDVIPLAIRRWRRQPLQSWRSGEIARCRQRLAAGGYEQVIDAQGLLKSAVAAHWARAPVAGFDRQSAREPLAALSYRWRYPVSRDLHAVERTRQLFAQALGYAPPVGPGAYSLDSGLFALDRSRFAIDDSLFVPDHTGFAARPTAPRRRLLFLHGTTRPAKHWPEPYWRDLCERASAAGIEVRLPWGNDAERARAERLADGLPQVIVLPRLTLTEVAAQLLAADAVVAVDTGLAHLAAALDRPTVALYGPTSPKLVGTYGRHQHHLVAGAAVAAGDIEPREMAPLTPAMVWQAVADMLANLNVAPHPSPLSRGEGAA